MEIGKLQLNSRLRVDDVKSRVQHGGMSVEYIRSATGKILATVHTTATQSYVTQFAGRTLATYRNGKTVDLVKNVTLRGSQLQRFVKG